MINPVSITDLLTAIGSDNIKFQYLATCMEGIKGAKGRNLITFGTDALTPSDVVLNTGPSGLIIWVEGDLIRQSLSDIKSGNGLTFGKVVEQRDELLAALEKLSGDVEALMKESGGVYGLHQNGEPAPWGELVAGGRHEEWLLSLSDAGELIAKIKAGAA
ncbi:hypothetical protein [Aeromonas enteropelogenes]|uniref:hypothetical protein n=1 Tax=Aeromonas enteropelogenes TaxID=29489 RepID=UPI002285965D|nr:hypothetical protein [Aeromonas enteropelogenes]MCZ0752545.1 hypothetical protein [Aeromonas enteropelogenes]